MQITGKWHPQGSAAQQSAVLLVGNGQYKLEISNQNNDVTDHQIELSGLVEEIQIADRLGNVERKLTLPDGSIFATLDNDAIDNAFHTQTRLNRFIHTLESNISFVIFAIIFTAVFGFSFFKWGVPWVSGAIAHALPHKTNEIIASHTLTFLDDYFFEPTKLDADKTQKIREHFEQKIVPLDKSDPPINYTLHFRDWTYGKSSIPNALALPSGDIILTDKFVELSKNQNEIDAVLLHEMGHIVLRHSLATVVETTIVATAVMIMTGDSTTAADMGIGIGSLLVSTNYSRGHETEADQYAFEHMLRAKIDPQAFSGIMNRITEFEPDQNVEPDSDPDFSKNKKTDDILDYISTHPNTNQRIQEAQRYHECFLKGLEVCDKN